MREDNPFRIRKGELWGAPSAVGVFFGLRPQASSLGWDETGLWGLGSGAAKGPQGRNGRETVRRAVQVARTFRGGGFIEEGRSDRSD
ncbi:hypothetical protein SBV1_2470012 [Verrucomicrobia bacterium]|nr:hypothetical protein SBV1_2470012 [Verrucomicrobiota bacterium]